MFLKQEQEIRNQNLFRLQRFKQPAKKSIETPKSVCLFLLFVAHSCFCNYNERFVFFFQTTSFKILLSLLCTFEKQMKH